MSALDELTLRQEEALIAAYRHIREECVTHGDHSDCTADECAFKKVQDVLQPFEPACPKCGWELCDPPTPRGMEEGEWLWRCPHCLHRWEPS